MELDVAKKMFCKNCGFMGIPKLTVKGSFVIELALWLCFLVPGLIYSIWRLTTKEQACPNCKNPTMIPLDSPLAKSQLSR